MKTYTYSETKDTRSGFGAGLLEAARKNPNIVGLCADLTGSLKMNAFEKEFPERFFQVGISEANMMSMAAGMTIGGKIPFTGTFANFATSRVYDQVRQSIAYSHKNVKICASHAGLTLGEDGATHQVLEDIGMMKMLPGMVVINPCDYNQTKAATMAIAEYEDVTILATGHLVWEAIEAGHLLADMGIDAEVINIHTIKPLDAEAILKSAKKTGCVVTAEEHQIAGGLGESVAQLLARKLPTPMEIVAVNDSFGESGKPALLMEKYGLTKTDIVRAVEAVTKRK